MTDQESVRGEAFARRSYAQHSVHFEQYDTGKAREGRMRSWTDDGNVDSWRHRRMYALVDPLIDANPGATWLTVGDGRLASEARYLRSKNVDVLATDISEVLLRRAQSEGHIDRYQVENAERLSQEAASFDFVLCKESYHHFPRPWIAVYEMLRIARAAVVLIEPRDPTDRRPNAETLFGLAQRIRRSVLRRPAPPPTSEYEETGNFQYTLSADETRKVAQALNLPCVAFAGLNDHYMDGVDEARAVKGDPIFEEVQGRIRRLDSLTRRGLHRPGLLVAVIFLRAPTNRERAALAHRGYEVVDLPRNPYATEP